MNEKLQNIFRQQTILVIDGSMSTALEQRGADLNDRLWTARVLAEKPDLIRQVHKAYFQAGADCGITASYQATIPGLIDAGYTEAQAEDILACVLSSTFPQFQLRKFPSFGLGNSPVSARPY